MWAREVTLNPGADSMNNEVKKDVREHFFLTLNHDQQLE